ncbi:hypothetical protein, partial [Candidatus Xenohaliotis californiensis]|uniref:hypothetical protein n=1 Tax=Candidatus Xenohaliotis californiensis TaxID=84677 RepID=UPI0030C7A742
LDKKIDDGEPGLGKIRCKGILFDCCYNSTKEKECVENSSYYIDNKRNGILVLYAGAIAKY